jgi:small-conductance mechanosensitive channel
MLQFVGKDHVLQLFGIPLWGINPENGKKLLLSVLFILILLALNQLLHWISKLILGERTGRARFWVKQVVRLVSAILLITGVISIWFDNPSRLASAAAFVTAGLAIASQRVITAMSAYFILLRGKTFHVGDRIVMGGVRGDVIALGFLQTTIMEMGQAPPEESDAPSVWVAGRQYTGRIVTITNDKIFDEPVYNFTREFPYIWEEMHIPIPYGGDRKKAEQIMLAAARRHTTKIGELSQEAIEELERRYVVKREELEPRVYYRLTDNWVQLSVRFVTEDHGIRKLKDAMSREILDEFENSSISIASGTYEVVGFPEVKVRLVDSPKNGRRSVTSEQEVPHG